MSDFLEVLRTGHQRQALEALRDRLAAEIDGPLVAPRDVASLSARLLDVLRDLANLPKREEASPVDDLAARRAARRAEAAVPERAAGGDDSRT